MTVCELMAELVRIGDPYKEIYIRTGMFDKEKFETIGTVLSDIEVAAEEVGREGDFNGKAYVRIAVITF